MAYSTPDEKAMQMWVMDSFGIRKFLLVFLARAVTLACEQKIINSLAAQDFCEFYTNYAQSVEG
jgi:hypothetical protein